MNDPFKQHGAFSWCELMTTDSASAKNFYGQLFGWKMNDVPMEDLTYTVVEVDEKGPGIGGIMPMPSQSPEMPPNWGVYITVENVDESAKLAEQLGGKILMAPQDVPDVGRFSLIQDPQGAVLSIITYSVAQ